MKTRQVPDFADTDAGDDKRMQWHESKSFSFIEWKSGPEESLKEFDNALKPHGLEVVTWDDGSNGLLFEIVKRKVPKKRK